MSLPTARADTTPTDDLEALRRELEHADWLRGDAEGEKAYAFASTTTPSASA